MPINSRAKGAVGERELAKFLQARGVEALRGGHEQVQLGGSADCQDLKHGIDGLHIEVKRVEKLNIWEAMAQAVRDAAEAMIPSVWYRRNRGEWWVAMPADDMIELLKLAGKII